MKVEIAIRPIKELIQELNDNQNSRKFLLFSIEEGDDTYGYSVKIRNGIVMVINGQFEFGDISKKYSHFADFPDIKPIR